MSNDHHLPARERLHWSGPRDIPRHQRTPVMSNSAHPISHPDLACTACVPSRSSARRTPWTTPRTHSTPRCRRLRCLVIPTCSRWRPSCSAATHQTTASSRRTPPMPIRDATELLQSIAHDHLLTAAERSAGMLALVSIPGHGALQRRRHQGLAGPARRVRAPNPAPTPPPNSRRRRPRLTPRPARPAVPSQTTNSYAATAARTHRRSGYDAPRHRPTR